MDLVEEPRFLRPPPLPGAVLRDEWKHLKQDENT